MKKLFTVFFLVIGLFAGQSFGQEYCGTPGGGPGFIGPLPPNLQNTSFTGPYYIKLYMYVLKNTDTGEISQSLSDIDQMVQIMSSKFSPLNIYFMWDCDATQISVSNAEYEFRDLGFNYIYEDEYTKKDGISIVLGPTDYPAPDGIGFANFIPGTALWVTGYNSQLGIPVLHTHVPAHEIGHCLGLYHTLHRRQRAGGGRVP